MKSLFVPVLHHFNLVRENIPLILCVNLQRHGQLRFHNSSGQRFELRYLLLLSPDSRVNLSSFPKDPGYFYLTSSQLQKSFSELFSQVFKLSLGFRMQGADNL